MKYKEDWQITKERWTKWWENDESVGTILQVKVPREKPVSEIYVPSIKSIEEQWTNIDYRIASAEKVFATYKFMGDAFPYFDIILGPGSFAIYIGSEPVFSKDTVWYKPFISDWNTVPELKLDPENKWWKLSREFAREGIKRGEGKFLVSTPDLIENLDTIASLRGIEKLLLDLVDNPQYVHKCQEKILSLWFECYEELYNILKGGDYGICFSAFSTWAPGKIAKLQCDMSCMISTDMFNEFVVPYLEQQCRWLDYSLYHLDGVGAIQHLDSLLSIEELDGIQWTPGEGQPNVGFPRWFPMYHKIQSAGKKLWLFSVPKEQVIGILKELSPRLCITTSCSSEKEGLELLRSVKDYTGMSHLR